MLNLDHVTLKFGGLTAVNDVSLEMKENGVYALIGPNGAGKTTLFNLISGVYKPNSGKIVFNGKDITGEPPFQVNKAGISRTYQNINLFRSMSCLENVMVGCNSRMNATLFDSLVKTPRQRKEEKLMREKSMELLKLFHIDQFADSRSSSLAYGEQRLLEIARAMASDPKLLLLDEPAAGMNETEKEVLSGYIRELAKKGMDILLVEHDMKVVMGVAHKIFVLEFGAKIAEGTPSEISSNPKVIEAYLGVSE